MSNSGSKTKDTLPDLTKPIPDFVNSRKIYEKKESKIDISLFKIFSGQRPNRSYEAAPIEENN